MSQTKPYLRAEGLHRWLGAGAGRTHVLRGIDLEIQAGQVQAIVGPSGCGKSTLLYTLGLLDKPDQGCIHFHATEMSMAPDSQRTRFRGQHIGFVFQFHFLVQELTAQENIALPLIQCGRLSRDDAMQRGYELLEVVDMADKSARRANHLSGGEQQRVALARALGHRPSLLLADEPTGNLDTENAQRVFALLQKQAHEEGAAVVLVTHNESLAAQCDQVWQMREGSIVETVSA